MKYAYWLHNIPGFGNAKIRSLYHEVGSAEELYHLPLAQIKSIMGIREEEAKLIHVSQRKWDVDKEWFRLMEQGIGFVSL